MCCLRGVLVIALLLIACTPEIATNVPAPSLIEAATPVGTQGTPETATNVPSLPDAPLAASPQQRPDTASPEVPGTLQPDSPPAPPGGSPSSAASPDELLARGLERREAGDYDAAAEAFFAAANAAPGTSAGRMARFYLAESFALRQRWTSAVEALNAFVADGIQDDLTARAWFWIARGHEEAGSHAAAVAAYEQFRSFTTPAETYARLRQAAQERVLGRLDAAAANYEAVARSDLARSQRAAAYEAAIQVRRDLGQRDRALQLANELLTLAEQPAYRARLLVELADLPYSQGDAALARAWLIEAIERAPASPSALAALDRLRADMGATVPPKLAARVYEAHGRWSDAVAALDAALATADDSQRADLLRRRALALRGLGDFPAALAGFDAAIAEAGESDAGIQARLDRIQTVGQSGATEAAIQGYRDFAATFPDDRRAPEALRRAATLLDRLGNGDAAAQQRIDLGRRYPSLPLAQEAWFAGGLHLFASGQAVQAHQVWNELAAVATGAVALRARYWAGRAALATGNGEEGRTLLDQVIAFAPDSYFAARARALLNRQETGAIAPDDPMSPDDWRSIEEWLATWAGEPPPDVTNPADDPTVQRARELDALHLRVEAMAEWSAALATRNDNPYALYLLARYAYEQGAASIALRAANRLIRLSPGGAASDAPLALRRILYPVPFTATVLTRSREFGVDPALMYALLRQESAFDPAATSWAGARGLAQVMPATGRGIAQALGVTGFREADLYLPDLSIRFGAFYLSRQMTAMNGSIEGALAAYNGGPGNARRWSGGAPITDPDLFAERIDFEETRNYVKSVIAQYDVYRRLYRWDGE
ncbi:MAG: transglycosylase SLT domain-containing protein [Roseiflexus sp.]|jgi:soluble lytic murein transglycosylase|nr:transglycosylase SLT domain-containing protein [Roseiflexus sp.]MBO9333637.1 transglycosylase SLT domain-containing protein [Roseiflexus sp.]MBO9364267.1 transglycosylase SLT domain-containing protein [Roseiflexus sp.]MBO9381129.1 transglycosylase SLT domain-containing protein [Roseiflexus sp.]MBO9388330.1 transglycosylase SLT domain-containing protein [Roseiflexus sp.]